MDGDRDSSNGIMGGMRPQAQMQARYYQKRCHLFGRVEHVMLVWLVWGHQPRVWAAKNLDLKETAAGGGRQRMDAMYWNGRAVYQQISKWVWHAPPLTWNGTSMQVSGTAAPDARRHRRRTRGSAMHQLAPTEHPLTPTVG